MTTLAMPSLTESARVVIALAVGTLASCTTDFDRFEIAGSDQQSSSMEPEGDAGGNPSDAGDRPSDAGGRPNDAGETDAGGFDLDAGISTCSLSFSLFPIVHDVGAFVPNPDETVLSVGLGDLMTSTEQTDEGGDLLYDTQIDVDQDGDLDVMRYVTDDEVGLEYNWSEATEVNMLVLVDQPSNTARFLCDLQGDLVLGCDVQMSCDPPSSSGGTPRCFALPGMPATCGLCRQITDGDMVLWDCEDSSEFFLAF